MLVSKFESFWGFEVFLAVLDDFLGPRGECLGGSWVVVEWSLLEHFSVLFFSIFLFRIKKKHKKVCVLIDFVSHLVKKFDD